MAIGLTGMLSMHAVGLASNLRLVWRRCFVPNLSHTACVWSAVRESESDTVGGAEMQTHFDHATVDYPQNGNGNPLRIIIK